MTDPIENLVLGPLRLIRSDIASVKDDTRELRQRVNTLEAGQALVLSHIAHLSSADAQLQASIDRLGARIERIEHRLGLVDAV